MTTTEAKWAERVREWRASGQTAETFAAGRQFEPSTLKYWASRLKRSASAAPATPVVSPAKPPVAMARVVRPQDMVAAVPAPRPAEMDIAVGTARISVGRGFDADLLREIVAALGGAR